ncbi:insulinase family protein [Agrobacterium rosae]|uniref:Pitrilysin family protein n=1 Tax=Agrobacterium rosae TaxID=1972867 RepID=A0AAE5VQA8_9HYPH|nr:pitrilysin family protein [Agrobacterium rosae]KAA3509563.1 insulinase family protein [Agrobacterium rosae]KAA3516464.1 insulinase family protein [Agrobacterium rosae]MCM2434977.1 insulinase family protein [Agrobacterium rosae]MDX8304883.1 pitrilysin family protein [Agrobacterium rosae]MDX8330801.1 pitrilysin family protein [Agrobacterium rosae]
MMKFFCLVTMSIGLILFCAQTSFAGEATWDPRLTRGTLDNGLSYIIYDSEKSEDPFNIRLIVHAGSVDEETPSGVAHILEHMVFQSSEAHPETLHRYFQHIGWRTGVQINAVTRETETQFMVRTRPNDALDLEGSLALMSDLAFGSKLLEADWEKERSVILEELRQGNSVADRISRQKKAVLRVGSRYVDRPTIGTRDGIEKVTIADIRAFHERFYVPANMTLILSGRIDKQIAVNAIQRLFGSPPKQPRPDRSYIKLPLRNGITTGLVQDEKGSSSQVTYALRIPMPDRKSEDGQFAYLQNYFLTRLIRDAVQSQALHFRQKVDALTFVAQETTEERVIFAFNARTHNHAKAWPILLETVERLRRNGISEDGFHSLIANARRINTNNVEAAQKRTFAEWEDKIASAVLTSSVVEDPQARAEKTTALLDRITFEGLNQRMRDMLSSPDKILFYQLEGNVTRVLPTVDEINIANARLRARDILPALPEIVGTPRAAKEEEPPNWPRDAQLSSRTGKIISETHNKDPSIIEWHLSNGDHVVWLERQTPDDKIYVSAQSHPGYMNAEFGSILSQTAIQLWQQSGFRFWSQNEFDRWQQSQKQRWSWVLKKGSLDIAVAAHADQLPSLLEQYASSVAFGMVREEALDEFRIQAASIEHTDDYTQLLYGSVAKELSTIDTSRVTIDSLSTAARGLLSAPVTWFVVGSSPDGIIKTAFTEVIGGVSRKKKLSKKPVLQRNGIHKANIETFDTDKARVKMSFFSPMNWTPEGAFIVSTLTPMTQQALKNKLRLELGGIYSVQFELELDPDSNRIIGNLSFECAPEKASGLANAAIGVLERMPELAFKADVYRLQADIEFAENGRLADPNTWLRRLAVSYLRYGNGGYLNRVNSLGKRLTPSLLASHARAAFRTDNIAVLVQMPKR